MIILCKLKLRRQSINRKCLAKKDELNNPFAPGIAPGERGWQTNTLSPMPPG